VFRLLNVRARTAWAAAEERSACPSMASRGAAKGGMAVQPAGEGRPVIHHRFSQEDVPVVPRETSALDDSAGSAVEPVSVFQPPLRLLLQAHDEALTRGLSPWDLPVQRAVLNALGVTDTLLRQ
jgi:hypothetical protein